MSDRPNDITGLLAYASQGDRDAQQDVFRHIESELRKIAQKYMRAERSGHTLQTTVLIDEAFMRLIVGANNAQWKDRGHFYRAAARAMRRLLVDHERQRRREKRGGNRYQRIDVDLNQLAGDTSQLDLLALDEALEELERMDARQCRVVELHHFAGQTLDETAKLLGVSVATVKTDWASARAWLHRELTGGDDDT